MWWRTIHLQRGLRFQEKRPVACSNERWNKISWEKQRPKNHKVIGSKWIFKFKERTPGLEPPIFKARLVGKCFSQTEEVDCHDIFSSVVKHRSIRSIISITAHDDLELEQLDVKTTFLHGMLIEQIFMSRPEGFETKGDTPQVCLIKRSLYGLKQAPMQCYMWFDEFMTNHDLEKVNMIGVSTSRGWSITKYCIYCYTWMICT